MTLKISRSQVSTQPNPPKIKKTLTQPNPWMDPTHDELCAVARCVRPSVTLVYCIQTAEDIVKLLSRPGSSSF